VKATTVPGCTSSTEMVRRDALDFGSSVAVRFPSSNTRPCSTLTSPALAGTRRRA